MAWGRWSLLEGRGLEKTPSGNCTALVHTNLAFTNLGITTLVHTNLAFTNLGITNLAFTTLGITNLAFTTLVRHILAFANIVQRVVKIIMRIIFDSWHSVC